MKALGLVVSDKIFENCILKTYFFTPWPTYATNWNGLNGLNNFGRRPPRDHACEVWSKSNEWFQISCLKKLLTDRRTDARTTDNGASQNLSTKCSRWANNRQRPVTIIYPERMDITRDLSFLNIHNLFTNERISAYLDKHNCMFLNTKDYFIKQISHLSKGMVIVASA